MAYQRPFLQKLRKRIQSNRKFIQVVMGPRQVGKTTLVHQLVEALAWASHFASADAQANAGLVWIEQQWEIARLKQQQSKARNFLLVIDEVQKVNNWSEVVKRQWDSDTRNGVPIKVILLGSSRLLLQQGLTESLAGRFESLYMTHWSFTEMNSAFGFTPDQFAWWGGYPGPAKLVKDEDRWKKYIHDAMIETSISKDILMLTRIDKPALLKKLFELGCLYSGQILSFTKILGQLHDAGNTTTLSHYLSLLDTAGLLAGIEKYSGNRLQQRSSSPKFLVHNTALLSAQHHEKFQEIKIMPDRWGRIVESSIGAHLLSHVPRGEINLFYWRHRNDEVDFVLERKGKLIALEIKSGASTKLSGTNAFKKEYPSAKVILVGDKGLPWQEFLKLDSTELF